MADTRIEDRRRAFTVAAMEHHPDWDKGMIAHLVNQQLLDSIRSSQHGNQLWMDRDADPKRTIEDYQTDAEILKAKYTDAEIAWLSTKAAGAEYMADPILFFVKYHRD